MRDWRSVAGDERAWPDPGDRDLGARPGARASVAGIAVLLCAGLSGSCAVVVKDPAAALTMGSPAPGDRLTRQAALEDLEFLVRLIDRVHADPYRFRPREAFEAERRRQTGTMPASLSKADLCLRLSRLVASLDDGHTGLRCDSLVREDWARASRATPPQTQRLLRFAPSTRLDDSQHLTIHWHDGVPGLDPGDRVLRINGEDADALVTAWASETSHDTEAGRRAQVARRLRLHMALHGIEAPYRLTVAPPGGPSRDVTVEGDPVNNQFLVRPMAPVRPPVVEVNLPPAPQTVFGPIRLQNAFFEYRTIEPDIAYMNFFSIVDGLSTVSRFEKAIDKMFTLIASDRPRGLIIDVRENGGGEDSAAAALLRHITEKPFRLLASVQYRRSQEVRDFVTSMVRIPFRWMRVHYLASEVRPYFAGEVGTMSPPRENPLVARPRAEPFFDGPVCVLVGPHTYSAAVEFADAVKTFGLATVVGEPTGGQPNAFGNDLPFVLPRSGLPVNIATVRSVRASGDPADFSPVQPDIVVRTTAADIRRGYDPVLERAKSCPARTIQ